MHGNCRIVVFPFMLPYLTHHLSSIIMTNWSAYGRFFKDITNHYFSIK